LRAFDVEQASKESVRTQPGVMHVEAEDFRTSLNITV